MTDEYATGLELARVLTEAGETRILLDWLQGEAAIAYKQAAAVAADPEAPEEDRAHALRILERLEEAFAEGYELVDVDEAEEP
jgi:hypothetical protein